MPSRGRAFRSELRNPCRRQWALSGSRRRTESPNLVGRFSPKDKAGGGVEGEIVHGAPIWRFALHARRSFSGASPAFASQSRRRGAVRGFHRIARGTPYRRLRRVCISRRDVHLADDIRSRHVAVPVAIAYAHRVAEMGLRPLLLMRARETGEQRREHLLDRLLPIPRRHGQPVHVKPVRSPCHSPRRLRRTKPRIQTAGPPPSTSTSLRAHFCGRDAPARRSAGSAISARCVERECREVAICHSDVAWSAEVHAPVTKHWRQPVPRTTPPVRCVAKGGPAA